MAGAPAPPRPSAHGLARPLTPSLMPRIALIADIHANFEALTAVLEAYESEKIDRYFCIGDIVGYGASPSECIQKLRDLNCLTVAGNHDFAVADKLPTDYFNAYAREVGPSHRRPADA